MGERLNKREGESRERKGGASSRPIIITHNTLSSVRTYLLTAPNTFLKTTKDSDTFDHAYEGQLPLTLYSCVLSAPFQLPTLLLLVHRLTYFRFHFRAGKR